MLSKLHMPIRRRWLVAALSSLLLFAASGGCGAQHATVAGLVTFAEKPLTAKEAGLVVSFLGSDGRPVIALVAADGRYEAADVLLGENQVSVYWVPPGQEVRKPKGNFDPKNPTPISKEFKIVPATWPIPKRYGDPSTSGLKAAIGAGANTFDIPLKTE